MPIYRGSRYENVDVTIITDRVKYPEGRPYLHPRRIIDAEKQQLQVIQNRKKSGEEVDMLTFKNGGKTTDWHVVADISDILNPFDIALGDTLSFPDRYKVQE